MELNTLFGKTIQVTVDSTYREVTYHEALDGKEDELIRGEYIGKAVGIVNLHPAKIPHLIVVDSDGRFNIVEMHNATVTNMSDL